MEKRGFLMSTGTPIKTGEVNDLTAILLTSEMSIGIYSADTLIGPY